MPGRRKNVSKISIQHCDYFQYQTTSSLSAVWGTVLKLKSFWASNITNLLLLDVIFSAAEKECCKLSSDVVGKIMSQKELNFQVIRQHLTENDPLLFIS